MLITVPSCLAQCSRCSTPHGQSRAPANLPVLTSPGPLLTSPCLGHTGFLAAPQIHPALSFHRAFASAIPTALSILPLGNQRAGPSLCATLCSTVPSPGKSPPPSPRPAPCWFPRLLPFPPHHLSSLNTVVRMNSPVIYLSSPTY